VVIPSLNCDMGEAFGIYSFGNDNQIIDYIVCSENPARLFGLYPTKGVLQVGSDADLMIVDPEKEATVDRACHRGGIDDWSVYDGWTFHGMPETTVIRGRIVVLRGEIQGASGFGRYVRKAGRAAA
jgi:dihydropyrimidinase